MTDSAKTPISRKTSHFTSISGQAPAAEANADAPFSEQDQSYQLAMTIAQAADERKGADITLIHTGEVSYLSDYFVIVTGFSKVQVRAIARAIQEQVEQTHHSSPKRIEGVAEGSWVVQDFGDVIVHIFTPQERSFYKLEAFWGHAEQLNFSAISPLLNSR